MLPIRHDRFSPRPPDCFHWGCCALCRGRSRMPIVRNRAVSLRRSNAPTTRPPGQPTSTATARECEACCSTCFFKTAPVKSQANISQASTNSSPLKKTTWQPTENSSLASDSSRAASKLKTNGSQVAQASHEVLVADPTMTMVPQPMTSAHGCDGHCDGGCASCEAVSSCDRHGQACGCNRCSAANYWVRAEYLAWSLDGMELPPLVTTSTGTTPANTGILGGGTTRVLFGGDTVNDDLRSGGRITLGWWADVRQSCGYEVSYLSVGRAGDDFTVSSTDVGRIARPVFDTALNAESAFLVAHPDFLSGSVSVTTESQLQSIDVIRRQCLRSSQWDRVDFLIGFKHGMLDELVRVDQSSRYTAAQGQILAGTTRQLFDKFETDNQFDGLQLGLNWQQRGRAFTLSTLAKVSLGVNRAEVTIDGRTTTPCLVAEPLRSPAVCWLNQRTSATTTTPTSSQFQSLASTSVISGVPVPKSSLVTTRCTGAK